MKRLLQFALTVSLLLMTGCPKHAAAILISETTPGVTSFLIYRGATCAALVQLATSYSTTYVDSAVSAGSSYCYAAKAVDSGGMSGYSNQVMLTIP